MCVIYRYPICSRASQLQRERDEREFILTRKAAVCEGERERVLGAQGEMCRKVKKIKIKKKVKK